MEINKHPYICHVMVCVNDRKGEKKSCFDGDSQSIRIKLKEELKKIFTKREVRVSQTLCLGLCGDGPNIMIYPQDMVFSHVIMDDIPEIINKIKEIVSESK